MRSYLFSNQIFSTTPFSKKDITDFKEKNRKDTRAIEATNKGYKCAFLFNSGELPSGNSSGEISSSEYYLQENCWGVKLD